jgi:hypothetical protein
MRALKIEKKTTSKIEQLKLIVTILCTIGGLPLSDTEVSVLAFYIQYKLSHKTDELLINSGIVKNLDVLRNVKTRLYKKGFLKRNKLEYKTYELNMNSQFNLDDNDIRLVIKLDNS